MKKMGFMIVYNDADYVDYAIRSVKDWVDELIIVEGAFKVTMACGMPPRSNDGTLDILERHVDNKRVFLKQVNLQEHKDHYQVGLDFCKERGADWAIMIDSDEVWVDSMKALVNVKLKITKPDVFEYRLNQYCFINDFNTYYNGQYPRIYRVTPKATFIDENEVVWPDFGKHEDRGRVEGHIQLLSPHLKNFHYGYVRRKARWKLKQDYMFVKNSHKPNIVEILKQYGLRDNKYIIPSDISIYEFTGKHPAIMAEHPFYNKSAEEIING